MLFTSEGSVCIVKNCDLSLVGLRNLRVKCAQYGGHTRMIYV